MFGETISITTQPVGFKKFYGLRKYMIKDEDGNAYWRGISIILLN